MRSRPVGTVANIANSAPRLVKAGAHTARRILQFTNLSISLADGDCTALPRGRMPGDLARCRICRSCQQTHARSRTSDGVTNLEQAGSKQSQACNDPLHGAGQPIEQVNQHRQTLDCRTKGRMRQGDEVGNKVSQDRDQIGNRRRQVRGSVQRVDECLTNDSRALDQLSGQCRKVAKLIHNGRHGVSHSVRGFVNVVKELDDTIGEAHVAQVVSDGRNDDIDGVARPAHRMFDNVRLLKNSAAQVAKGGANISGHRSSATQDLSEVGLEERALSCLVRQVHATSKFTKPRQASGLSRTAQGPNDPSSVTKDGTQLLSRSSRIPNPLVKVAVLVVDLGPTSELISGISRRTTKCRQVPSTSRTNTIDRIEQRLSSLSRLMQAFVHSVESLVHHARLGELLERARHTSDELTNSA